MTNPATTDRSAPTASTDIENRKEPELSKDRVRAVLSLLIAVVVGGLVSMAGLTAIGTVEWPAFNSSNVTRSLTTAGQVLAIAILVIAALLYRYGKGRLLVPVLSAAATCRTRYR